MLDIVMRSVCATCLQHDGGELRFSPTLRHYIELLLDFQMMELSRGVCWQCEAAILNIQRFQLLAQTSQHTLERFRQESQTQSVEPAKPVILNTNNRLTSSPVLLTTTPGDCATLQPKDTHKLATMNAPSNGCCHTEIVVTDIAAPAMRPLVHLNAEHEDSDQSEDEALSRLRQRKLKMEESERSGTDGNYSDEHVGKRVKIKKLKKKKKLRRSTNFRKVLVDESEIHSDLNCERELRKPKKRKEGRKCKVKQEDKPKGRQNDRFKKVVISEEEMLRGREEERGIKWYVQAPYKCETCIIGYYNEGHLSDHNKIKHSQDHPHACSICGLRSAEERQLSRHRALHYRRIECRVCGARHRAYRDMWRHYVRLHEPGKTFPCALCARVFQTRPSLVYHRRCEHRERCKCEHCGDTFRNQTTYKRHLLIHTGMPTYECAVCARSYRGKFGFLTHMKTHGPPPRDAYCVECDVQFKHGFQYRRHLKISTRHLRDAAATNVAHALNKKYPCTACEKKFVSPSVLKRHYDSVHLKLKRYNCEQCDKNYATPAALWTHRKLQHERVVPPRDKVCEVCGKGFRSNTSLVDHMRSHTGERPFSCDACAATFRHNSGLYMHKRLVHKMSKKRTPLEGQSGAESYRTDLPLACAVCPATFRHTSGLYMHTRLAHDAAAAARAPPLAAQPLPFSVAGTTKEKH